MKNSTVRGCLRLSLFVAGGFVILFIGVELFFVKKVPANSPDVFEMFNSIDKEKKTNPDNWSYAWQAMEGKVFKGSGTVTAFAAIQATLAEVRIRQADDTPERIFYLILPADHFKRLPLFSKGSKIQFACKMVDFKAGLGIQPLITSHN